MMSRTEFGDLPYYTFRPLPLRDFPERRGACFAYSAPPIATIGGLKKLGTEKIPPMVASAAVRSATVRMPATSGAAVADADRQGAGGE